MHIDQGAGVVGSPERIEASTGHLRVLPELAEKPGTTPFQDHPAFAGTNPTVGGRDLSCHRSTLRCIMKQQQS